MPLAYLNMRYWLVHSKIFPSRLKCKSARSSGKFVCLTSVVVDMTQSLFPVRQGNEPACVWSGDLVRCLATSSQAPVSEWVVAVLLGCHSPAPRPGHVRVVAFVFVGKMDRQSQRRAARNATPGLTCPVPRVPTQRRI